jgi:hypothetical protein
MDAGTSRRLLFGFDRARPIRAFVFNAFFARGWLMYEELQFFTLSA